MKRHFKILAIPVLLGFSLWMAITHEPKQVLPDPVLGTVMQHRGEGVVLVALGSGESIEVSSPRQLPKQIGLSVTMEVTTLKWTGKQRYRIKSWRSE